MLVKQSAIQARQNIAAILAEEPTELDLDQMEEVLKGNFKTLKDYVSALREFCQARPGAEEALAILDEALQVNLSISATPKLQSNTLIEIDAPSSATEASVLENGIVDSNTGIEVALARAEMAEIEADESGIMALLEVW